MISGVTATTLLWLAGVLLMLAVATLALSRPFRIDRLSIFGSEATLAKPILWPGYRLLVVVAVTMFLGAIITAVLGARATLVVSPEWPTKFDDVKTAELQISEVDDEVDVLVNRMHVAHAEAGPPPPWMSIKDALVPGANGIEIWITNGKLGGCAGTVTLRLNGVTDAGHTWTWENSAAPEGSRCFTKAKTLNLDP
jgi:hypothetical protein